MEQQFFLKCKCGYFRKSTGLSTDLADLVEVKKCANCGGPRTFKCPKCARPIKMIREKRNAR